MDKQKKAKTGCSNCGSDKHMTRKCTSCKCGVCGKTFNSAVERSTHWKREHMGKGTKSKHDEDKPTREPDTDNPKKKQNAAKEKTRKRVNRAKKVRYDDESAADSEIQLDDESRCTTDDEFDPNSS